MKRGLVLVEGQTEERFVTACLDPYLHEHGLTLTPTLVKTKRVVGGSDHKGGVTSYGQVSRDLALLCRDSNAAVITTVLDYYALPDDFPGSGELASRRGNERVVHIETRWSDDVGDRRFVPHLALHELEAWIYAAPDCLEPWMFDDDPSVIEEIKVVAGSHPTPEDIDEGPSTSPSRRLRGAFPAFQKTLHGTVALAAVGISRIRVVCPHFDAWLRRIEQLVAAS